MNRIIDVTKTLESVLLSIPAFQIFASRGESGSFIYNGMATATSAGYNITTYNWKEFSQAFNGVGEASKRQLHQTAELMAYSSSGKDYEFWRCVANAIY